MLLELEIIGTGQEWPDKSREKISFSCSENQTQVLRTNSLPLNYYSKAALKHVCV